MISWGRSWRSRASGKKPAGIARSRCGLPRGERVGALQEYDEALRLRPDYGPAHYRLALALMMERRVDEAAVRLAKVLRTNPKHRGARKLMRALEENRPLSDY